MRKKKCVTIKTHLSDQYLINKKYDNDVDLL